MTPGSTPSLPEGWTEVAPMPAARARHAAVLLDDGRVLISGGEQYESGAVRPSKTCEIYDPVADEWTATTPMNRPRLTHGILLMYDGRVLVWGGYDSSVGGLNYLNDGEIYDPATEQWTLTPDIGLPGGPSPRLFRHNGEHFVAARSGIYEYDPATNTVFDSAFSGNSLADLSGASVSVFPDGGYLIAGGNGVQGAFNTRYVEGTQVYDQVSHGKHAYHSTLILDDSLVLLLGGVDSRGETFNRKTKQWELLSNPIASLDEGIFQAKPGKAISFGGDRVGEFAIDSRTFAPIPKPEPYRWGADGNTNAVQLDNGNIWVCGGWRGEASPQALSDRTFIYAAVE